MKKPFFLSFLALSLAAGVALAQVNVTTYHNDNARTGQNLAETTLNTSNVNAARFGLLFSRPTDSIIWSQPLYVSGLAIPGKGTHNVIYVMDEVGGVYAFDADDPAQTAPLWRVGLVQAPYQFDASYSTPVIDSVSKTIYLVIKKATSAGAVEFWLHALDITTGADKTNSPVKIAGDVAGTGVGSAGGRQAFNPTNQYQRPALLLANGNVYVAFGFGGKVGTSPNEFAQGTIWNGWIFSYSAATLARQSVFAIAPDANGGGVWQAANGLAADSSGSLYATSGNGNGNPNSFSANTGGHDYGNSLVKLTPALSLSSFFTPFNQAYLEAMDQDFGASGPMLVPGTTLVITGDKIGRMYVCNRNNLGGYNSNGSNLQIVQDFPAWNGHLHGGPVYWNSATLGPVVYGWPEHDYLKGFKVLGDTGLQTTPLLKSTVSAPPGMPGGFLSVSAHGSAAGSGIVWATLPRVGDANAGQVPGVLRAFDAATLQEIWNSDQLSSRDNVGTYSKFSPPTVVNGKVYLSSFSNRLNVYGLLSDSTAPTSAPTLTATAGIYKTTLNWNSIAGANGYYVKRATSSAGPFVAVARGVLGTSFDDTNVSSGTLYYYVVSAANGKGEGPDSNVASARPFAPASGTVISVDFTGGGSNGTPAAMGASEVAGIVPVTNWNAASQADGTSTDLKANGGTTTTADATWSSLNTASTSITDAGGNSRMMKGNLSGNTYPYVASVPHYPSNPEDQNRSYSRTTATVSQIPASFVSSGYDLYVYSDGENPTASRQATFQVLGVTKTVTDSKNRNFDGTFSLPNQADVGNYVVFPNLTASSFTLEAIPGNSTDTTPRAPLNGFQIVQHQTAAPPVGTPSNLRALAGNGLISLDWNAVAGAASYSVFRATVSGGPYSAISINNTNLSFVDVSVTNGTAYYYVVAAADGNGLGANSNQATATPLGTLSGRTISLNFGGSGTSTMGATEAAGTSGVGASNWNNTLYASGGLGDVVDSAGAKTTADVTWSADATGDLGITDTAGNGRMMRSYITGLSNAATVNVFNLPPSITRAGYNVYIYADNNNGGARSAVFKIGSNSIGLTDPANTNFTGTYALGANSNGNTIRFLRQTATGFTLTATPGSTSDGIKGAPINGLQIVARSAPQNGTVTPSPSTSAANSPHTITATYSDGDGFGDLIYCQIRILPVSGSGAALQAYYNPVTNLLYLRNDAGNSWLGGFAPGSANTISNSQGTLDCANTTTARSSGTTVIVNWRFTPTSAFVGSKQVQLSCTDYSSLTLPFENRGSWTITAPAPKSSVRVSSRPQSRNTF